MAGTTTKNKHTVYSGSAQHQVVVEFNKLVDDVETLRAAIDAIADKLDAENVTNLDTDYAATAAVATAGTLTAAKIGDPSGTAISS